MADAPAPPIVGLHVGQLRQPIPGGIGRYVTEIGRGLRERGVTVRSFATGPPPAGFESGHVDLGRPRGSLRYAVWHRFRRLPVAVEADVIHAPSLAVPPAGATPLVVTVHDLAFLRLPQYFTIRGLRFHERGLQLARAEAAAIICPSQFIAGELISEGFDPGRVHVAHHGIDDPPPTVDATVAEVLDRYDLSAPFVLFVGTLEPRKGLETLIEGYLALRRTRRDVSLVLVGARGWGHLPRLDRPGVRRLGAVPDHDLDALYRAAAVLAYPSEYEGFGLPVIEAMARGCPVVTSSVTSLPEVVGDAGRVVDPKDPDALARALGEVIEDEATHAAMREAGRRRARTFTWSASVDAHLAAYRSAAGPPP